MACWTNDKVVDPAMLSQVLESPVGRRAILAWGVRGAIGLYAALGTGAVTGLLGALSGCYRAPGTARDQL
ncbi:MAG TPA: hypothetical protein VFR79_05545, partial [Nitrospira sp.]|nr:hypothetical protein [Nitrospira sp.]